ncbi:D-alanyl-D-alanine carboxypeptidase/D-alanyl-D-alanine-endopeptidase [Aquincola sp. S2]|uniref:D-alanyl-D-alanine carboxypeptidase/D-alanyl-D-alanine-endopeptidase n=1 Tax=Pseudaquabacterium terrae TaxID=2732868 RepID=A0ABX2EDD3_9BURK|nr:D-alanyl-D-alanine carboxypeptidase/D-alanyl-D-alanine-endopeptidase [Aquabacterium terrae]NRF66704.1 D-alanyl-D-alanine carboxypeptidase/D-alanyl-D-alanine-endopeptidase [Aquabacterium terrae]
MPASGPARRAVLTVALLSAIGAAGADTPLPAELRQALARAQVPPEAISVLVQEAGSAQPRLAWQAQQPVNPASLFKLATTFAALELLGPGYTWNTPVWLKGRLRDGVLEGDLVIKGSGDPKLVPERVWLLLRRVQQQGVREIRGDIVLDRSAFVAPSGTPADFDGEPLKPYNVQPDALLLSHKSVLYTFTPDVMNGVARVGAEPPLHGLQVDPQVPLLTGPCDDWRAALKATPADPERMRFAGGFPLACGERNWPVAYADPASYNARLLQALWRELGGRLTGSVRDGVAPSVSPSFEVSSPALAELVRDINKFSNNVMAQQVFLTLGLTQRGSGSPEAARAALRDWLQLRLGERIDGLVIDNGSGLSRDARMSAEQLALLLQAAWRSPVMPELIASLPLAGVDGTARRARSGSGRAHLKTGSLRDSAGIAGFALGHNGRRWIVVAIVQHANAGQARPALDALVQWVIEAPTLTSFAAPKDPKDPLRAPWDAQSLRNGRAVLADTPRDTPSRRNAPPTE